MHHPAFPFHAMTGDISLRQIDGHAAAQRLVIEKKAFDGLALITQRDKEFLESEMRKMFDDVPKHRIAADFHHRFGLELSFFCQPRAQATSEDDYFHKANRVERFLFTKV